MVLANLPLLVILGPTATGKTDLALHLAKKFNGELIACDSRQVYTGLDIGTGKLPGGSWKLEIGSWKREKGYWELDGVKIWMYDVVKIGKQYTVADYVKDANRVIEKIRKSSKPPIIVGGTGLYLKAVTDGLSNLQIPTDKKLRHKLFKLSLKKLQNKLQKIAPDKWESLNNSDKNNPIRLIRALEVKIMGPLKYRISPYPKYDVLKIGLNAPRDILFENINQRVYKWIEDGIMDEVKNLIKSGIRKKRFKDIGLEYAVILQYLDGDLSYDQCLEKMQTKVRQYAKRQLTWFKKEDNVFWFDIIDKDYLKKVEKLVSAWYYKGTNAAEN